MNNRTYQFYINGLLPLFSCVLIGFWMLADVAATNANPVEDFDGDGKSDIAVFRPSDGYWYIAKSSGGYSSVRWGLATDTPVADDYDGDGKADVAVFRRTPLGMPVNNDTWYILKSSDNSFRAVTWLPNSAWYFNARPVPDDYDGDGKTDVTVFRGSDAIGEPTRFMALQSLTGAGTDVQWGINGNDKPVPADYDGDGKSDVAVYRYGTFNTQPDQINTWFILQSSDGRVRNVRFGLPTDRLVPADYDGDGKADIAVWRPSDGYWYRINSRDNSFYAIRFGLSDDKPTPADYDGDGKTDIAVFRPSNGVWYLLRSTEGFTARQFGWSDDVPLPFTRVR
ncbi:MAG TPA: VCBS repeat-containing protein [Pyrinomonadaceae bacterium]|nr:VCBS repeat-containing protein [Pyrinomonadaceae bacterium]